MPEKTSENVQDLVYRDGFDYSVGSPHLSHEHLRSRLCDELDATIGSLCLNGEPEVLEVGAGHGDFTAQLRASGARVTTIEMSHDAADRLAGRYATDDGVEVIYDPDGTWPVTTPRTFDAVVCLSVLHHIPDYRAAAARFAEMTRPGGAFLSWQDPLWYPRLTTRDRTAARAAYYAWRVGQKGRARGLATLSRRMRGVLDPKNPADNVEYHVVRDGVDEEDLRVLMEHRFERVAVERYWSTQSAWWQKWGERRGYVASFGLVATGRKLLS
jgi:SAM-dependent methyltransferase